jgi:hypothetical protein
LSCAGVSQKTWRSQRPGASADHRPWPLLAAARSGELAGAAAARAKQRPLWIVAQRGAVEEADAGAVAGDGNQGRERSGRGKRDRRRDIPRDCDGRASRAVPPLSRSRTHSRPFRRRHRRGACAGLWSWRGAPDRDDLGTAMVSDGGRVVMLLSVLSADVRKPPKNQPGGSRTPHCSEVESNPRSPIKGAMVAFHQRALSCELTTRFNNAKGNCSAPT